MSERGSGLLDAVAATAVALTIGAATADLSGSLYTLARVSRSAELLGTARNMLDYVVGAPCAPLPECPAGLSCNVLYEPIPAAIAGTVRASVTVTRTGDPDSTAVRLRTAVVAACG